MGRNFASLLALVKELGKRLFLHCMAGFHRVCNIAGRGCQRRRSINHETSRRGVLAGKAGRYSGEIVFQCGLKAFFFTKQLGFVFRRKAGDVAVQYGTEQPFFIGELRIQRGRFCAGGFHEIGERGRFISVLPEECHGLIKRGFPVEHFWSATAFFCTTCRFSCHGADVPLLGLLNNHYKNIRLHTPADSR